MNWGRPSPDSLDPSSRHSNLNSAGGYLRVLFLSHKVNLSCSYVGMSSELPHFMHRRPVANGVVDRRLPQAMDADAAASEPLGVDPRRLAVLLHQPPGSLPVQVPPHEAAAVRCHRPE